MKYNKGVLSIASICIILFLFVFYAWVNGIIGVSKDKIEHNARNSQKIDQNWLVAKDVNDKMGALLFYDQEVNEQIFSIYLNRDNFSCGYIFKTGGTLGIEKSEIQGFSYTDEGMALLSMNELKVAEIKIDNGTTMQTISIDPDKPFAVVIPPNGTVGLYKANGESIAIDNIKAY